MATDNKKNGQISDQDQDPTVELEPLSEEAYEALMLADGFTATSEPAAETEPAPENRADYPRPISLESASEIRELRDEIKYRVELNSILQHGFDQQRSNCKKLEQQVASLQRENDRLSHELKISRQQEAKTKKKLAKTRESKKELLADLEKRGELDAAIADQTGEVKQLSKDNLELSVSVSELESKFETATQNVDQLEARLRESSAENAKLSAELISKNAEIDVYENQLATLRRKSRILTHTPSHEAPSVVPMSDGHVGTRRVLVGLDDTVSDTYIVDDGVVVIGSSADNDIQIQSKFVSRHHAQLANTGNGCVLEDLNSTNGTFINSRRISKRLLRAGDIVTVGKHRFRYDCQAVRTITNELGEYQ